MVLRVTEPRPFCLLFGRLLMVLVLLATIAWHRDASAQIGSDRYAAIVQDARTGATLMAANADEHRHPASLTKMMTLYMLFEALRSGRVRLDTPITMSREAAAQPPSKLGLPAGSSLTAEQAILALVTRSANDVAYAIGEHLAGSEDRFAQVMTQRARSLGMTRTTFRNASGLPDFEQVTTARDMALLGRRLRDDFPTYFPYFSADTFRFRGRVIANHNRLLGEYEGTDGIKTGFINDSGFNIVTSVQRDGQRLVAAVFGGSSGRERDRHMMEILDASFARLGVGPREMRMAAARPSLGLVSSARASTVPTARLATPAGRGAQVVQPRLAVRPVPQGAARTGTQRAPVAERRIVVRRDEPPNRASPASRSALSTAPSAQILRPPVRQAQTQSAVRYEQGDRTPPRPSSGR